MRYIEYLKKNKDWGKGKNRDEEKFKIKIK
jgi:hypothetical protein